MTRAIGDPIRRSFTGTVKEIGKDGTALVATEGGDEGWVPIKALKGFESWGSKKA